MEHIAIDLGGTNSQICVRNADGSIIEQRSTQTKRLAGYLAKRTRSRVILETCTEAFAIADAACVAGHEVRVVPATLVKSLGVGSRGTKTDKRDAQILSEVSTRIDLPSVHVPSMLARQYKALCTARESLIRARTLLINSIRGRLRSSLIRIRTGAVTTLPERVRAGFLATSEGISSYTEAQLKMVERLNEQLTVLDEEVTNLARESQLCRRLMTVPGVGPVVAIRFVAAIDTIERFGSAHEVQAYLGLVPGEHSSSQKVRRTGITKAGSAQVRRVLTQAAWVALQRCPHDPMVLWAKAIAARRGKVVAAIALSRKIAGILYAIWRDGVRYDASRGAEITNI